MITESQISLICLRIAHVASSTAQVFVIRIIANLTARGVVALDLFNIIDALVLTSNMKGIAQHARPRKARRDEAHWSPRRSYICSVKRTTAAPQKLRIQVFAARAEAAWCCGRITVVLLDKGEVVLVDKGGAESRHEDTDCNGNEHKTSLSSRVSLALLVDNGVGDEEHVQKTVEDTHVQGDKTHDELAKEELERSNEEDSKTFRDGAQIELLLSYVVSFSSFGSELAGATGQDSWGIGLGDGEGSGRERSHGNTTLFIPPHIGKRTTDKGHGRRESNTVNGTADEKSLDILGHGARNDEDESNEESRTVDNPSSVNLRQRRKSHRSNTKAHNKQTDTRKGKLVADIEIIGHTHDISSDDGRAKGDDEACQRNAHSAPPLVRLAPVLRVLRVSRCKSDELVAAFSSGLVVCGLSSDLLRLDGTGDGTAGDFNTVFIEVGICAEGTVGEVDVEVWIPMFLLRTVS
ncbi:hypothetical protein HG531_010379 [Fusarium graminearum]|nr:hypothetical protein HG531_010379 [Fusarium graminearum]